MSKLTIALIAGAALITGASAQAQQYAPTQYGQPVYGQPAQPRGNPLNSVFACQNPNNRQGTGAVVGGLIGGVVGNQVAGDEEQTLGTILGAALGAGIGSYIGCRMGQGDQQRAQAALSTALAQGRPQTWVNPQSGASGRVDIVDTFNYGYGPADYAQALPPPGPSLQTVRWTQGVEQPREYLPSEGVYRATTNAAIRSGPSQRARQLGTLRNGDSVDGLVRVEGTDWVLASSNGVAIGYVQETNLRFMGVAAPPAPPPPPVYDPRRGPTCRTFEQTFTPRGGRPESTRNTACQTASGEWVVTA